MSELVEKARALADAATEGPWGSDGPYYWNDIDVSSVVTDNQRQAVTILPRGMKNDKADAIFIAEARTLVPALCDEIDAQAARIRELEADLAYERQAPLPRSAMARRSSSGTDHEEGT